MSIRRTLEQILILGWMNSLPTLRQPLQVITLIIFAGLPLFYLWALGGMSMISLGVAGAMISMVAMSGMFVSQDIIFNRIFTKHQDILVASPVEPISYLLGMAVSNLLSVGVGVLPYAVLLYLQGKLTLDVAFAVLIPLLICYISNLMFGFYLGTVVNDVKTGNALGNIMILGLIYLPPVYYPITSLPEFLRMPCLIIPTVSASQIIGHALGSPTVVADYVPIAWLILILSSLIFGVLTIKNVRWREK